MSDSPAHKFTSLARAKKPEALELFTDRIDQQRLFRRIFSPRPTGELEEGWKNLLTVFYGVGGVGKTTLRQQARKIAREEFPGCACVVTDFDGEGWTTESAATRVFGELCRCLAAEKIAPMLTLTLLALDRGSGEKGVSLDDRYGLVFAALDKGAEWAALPGLGEAMKGIKWLAQKAHARAIRERINELNLSPEEHEGKINLQDLQAKLPLALFHDISGWLAEKPERQLVWLLDGFERIQSLKSQQPRHDAQSRLREFIREVMAQETGHFRLVVFGREKLDWAELYQEPWQDISTEHCLGGLAEADARDFLRKSQAWLQGHGQGKLAEAIARHTDPILDASDEEVRGQRAFYPFYLSLSLDMVERALAAGREPDLGTSPVELQERFLRYLSTPERQALKILALAEVFNGTLFDWLITRQLVVGYPLHSFDAELLKGRSYFLAVEQQPGQWKFHKLMEDALHALWRNTDAERGQGRLLVEELLRYYGDGLKEKAERDWTEADAETWRRGMEILVTQGLELGLLERQQYEKLMEAQPWSVAHFRCLNSRNDFARRILKETERLLGPEHPDTLSSANNLANLLSDQGDYRGAEPLYRRALAGREKVLGPEHPESLESMEDLAGILKQIADYAGAKTLYRRAMEARGKNRGWASPLTLITADKLVCLLESEGDFAGADSLYRLSRSNREKALGREHQGILGKEDNQALPSNNPMAHKEEMTALRKIIKDKEQLLGSEHPSTLATVRNLGVLVKEQGDCLEAESLYRRALMGREKVLGTEHPDALVSLNDLANLLSDQGDYMHAEPLYRRALAGYEKALGPEHLDTLSGVNNLTILLNRTGRLPEALELLRQCAANSKAALVHVRYNLACYECLIGNQEEAKRLIAEEIAEKPAARERALKDNDLKPIWDFVGKIRPIEPPSNNENT